MQFARSNQNKCLGARTSNKSHYCVKCVFLWPHSLGRHGYLAPEHFQSLLSQNSQISLPRCQVSVTGKCASHTKFPITALFYEHTALKIQFITDKVERYRKNCWVALIPPGTNNVLGVRISENWSVTCRHMYLSKYRKKLLPAPYIISSYKTRYQEWFGIMTHHARLSKGLHLIQYDSGGKWPPTVTHLHVIHFCTQCKWPTGHCPLSCKVHVTEIF